MSTSVAEIRGYLAEAQRKGSTHLIMVCDTYDHEDYPVFVTAATLEDLQKKVAACSGDMQRVMEVYAMHLPIEAQMAERRAYHVEVA